MEDDQTLSPELLRRCLKLLSPAITLDCPQLTLGREEGGGPADQALKGGNRTGGHEVESPPQLVLPKLLGPSMVDLEGKAELVTDLLKESRLLPRRLEELDGEIWPLDRDDDPGESSPGAEVQDAGRTAR